MANIDHHRSCYDEWMDIQQLDLAELLQALTVYSSDHNKGDNELNQLINKILQHVEDYVEKRSNLVRTRAWTYIAPPWYTSLEKSMFWLGGCRPSSYIRLIYALSGVQVETQVADLLQGNRKEKLGDLSAIQLSLIDKLQGKIIREEETLTSRIASLEEDMLDNPFAKVAMKVKVPGELGSEVEVEVEVEEAFIKNKVEMARGLEEADRMRFKIIKEMTEILDPIQGVQFLIATKKLCICLHEWGKNFDKRD